MLKTKNIHLNEIKDRNLDLPIKLKINKPKQVGSDRVVNAIAAFKIYKKIQLLLTLEQLQLLTLLFKIVTSVE